MWDSISNYICGLIVHKCRLINNLREGGRFGVGHFILISAKSGERWKEAIGTLTTANFTGSVDRPVGSLVHSEPLRISLVNYYSNLPRLCNDDI